MISNDVALAVLRRRALGEAGFSVISKSEVADIQSLCSRYTPHAVIIGESLPPSEKRKAWWEVRQFCHAPLLEHLRTGEVQPFDVVSSGASQPEDEVMQSVASALRKAVL